MKDPAGGPNQDNAFDGKRAILSAMRRKAALQEWEKHKSPPGLPDVSHDTLQPIPASLDEALRPLRQTAVLKLPRASKKRKKVALEKIESIISVLEGPSGQPIVTEAEIDDVVAFMDFDQSGEIDVKEFQVSLSSAKQGRVPGAALTRNMLKIDDELRLRHMRVADLFTTLDADGGGTLSREELQEGLSALLGHDRQQILLLREHRRAQKLAKEQVLGQKRMAVKNFLDSLDSVPAEVMQGHGAGLDVGGDDAQVNDIIQGVSAATRISDDANAEIQAERGARYVGSVEAANRHLDALRKRFFPDVQAKSEGSDKCRPPWPGQHMAPEDEAGAWNAILERQLKVFPNDRYVKILLQRRFELERLPNLFEARSRSLLHQYAVKDPFDAVKKQARRTQLLR